MSHREDNVFVVQPTPPAECEKCGTVAELRPYGPNGENICYSCGMLDIETTRKQLRKRLDGATSLEVRGPKQ